ncbi:MAG: TadE family protein [Myxococcota bacterium]
MGAKQLTIKDARERNRARGSVLAEFALLSFVVWLLLAGVLEIGRALTAQQLLQHAARTMAREMARLALPANWGFEDAAGSPDFRQNVLDDRFLVIDSGLLARCGHADFGQAGHNTGMDALFTGLPIGNRLLRPLMIGDRRGSEQMLRYPGALLVRDTPPSASCDDGSRYAVGIAELDEGAGQVIWHPVVENSASAGAPGVDFPLADGGWVGLRVNYPFQSAGLLAAEQTGVLDPRTGRETQRLIDADQALSDVGLDALGGEFSESEEEGGAYAGLRGLGRLYAMPDTTGRARAIRPYRRLLAAQAGFRRELFMPVGPIPGAGAGGGAL